MKHSVGKLVGHYVRLSRHLVGTALIGSNFAFLTASATSRSTLNVPTHTMINKNKALLL